MANLPSPYSSQVKMKRSVRWKKVLMWQVIAMKSETSCNKASHLEMQSLNHNAIYAMPRQSCKKTLR